VEKGLSSINLILKLLTERVVISWLFRERLEVVR